MRLLDALARMLKWRWAPFLGLVLGALAFVSLAVTLIPDEFGAMPEAGSGDKPAEADDDDSTSDERGRRGAGTPERPASPAARQRRERATPPAQAPANPGVQSFFGTAPPVELPPPLEEPEPPPAPAPAPTPTEIVVPPPAP